MAAPKILRFAPSPTGFLHIGGARTALFNWLLAKQSGGKMRLRIEDTDRARSTQAAIDAIQDGLKWLGLDWDDEIVFQSKNIDRHRTIATQLLDQGLAYRCYATPEALDAMRKEAQAKGLPPRYNGLWRDRDPSEAPAGAKYAIRLKSPLEGVTRIVDAVQGDVDFPNEDLDDLVLMRSDGTPTYMLAVVVDDHDMGVTDIVRGVDHLTNAARQQLIIEALGWPKPKLAHIPLILGPDGAKLSKRHGALGVEAYRAMGYLPDVLRNYLVRLGWSHGDQEIFSDNEMIKHFSLAGVGKSAARFDYTKLEHFCGLRLRACDKVTLSQTLYENWPFLQGPNVPPVPDNDEKKARLDSLLDGLKARAKTLVELTENAAFLFAERPLEFSHKARILLDEKACGLIAELIKALEALDTWNIDNIEAAVRNFAEQNNIKLGAVAQPLRAALTGDVTSPGVFDVLAALGRKESLSRLNDVAKQGGHIGDIS